MSDPVDPVALARRYVELSNEARLADALAMFAADASYASSQVGTYEGRAEIAAMMRSFFTRFPAPHWEVAEYVGVEGDAAEFAFVMTATAADGTRVERRGIERITFDERGLITRVHVDVAA